MSFDYLIQHAWVLPLVIAWSIAWKGVALWKAARIGSKPWFVVLLLVNTVGLLEIIYIYAVSKQQSHA